MPRIDGKSPLTTTPQTPQPEEKKPVVDVALSGGPDYVTAEVAKDLGESTQLSAAVDFDAEGLQRAHARLEHFTGGDDGQKYRIRAKIGTALTSDDLKGSLFSKVEFEQRPSQIFGALSGSYGAKVGYFSMPKIGSVRAGVAPERSNLFAVGVRGELQLNASAGDTFGIMGRYGAMADAFFEPFPGPNTRAALGDARFDDAKTSGFSEMRAYANTRAALAVGDHVAFTATHNMRYYWDDITTKRTVDDHSMSGGVLGFLGKTRAEAEVRIPIEQRTKRALEGHDGVTARLELGVQPHENVDISGFYQHNFDSGENQVGVGLNIGFGGPKKVDRSKVATDYATRYGNWDKVTVRENRLQLYGDRPQVQWITPAQAGLSSLAGKSFDEARELVDTPEKAAALLQPNFYFVYGFHDFGRYSARGAWRQRVNVVCSDQHAVQAAFLTHHGYENYNVSFTANNVHHMVTTYVDPATGKWNIMDYNKIHECQADTPKDAVKRYEPGALEVKLHRYSDTEEDKERPDVVMAHRFNPVAEARNFWDD